MNEPWKTIFVAVGPRWKTSFYLILSPKDYCFGPLPNTLVDPETPASGACIVSQKNWTTLVTTFEAFGGRIKLTGWPATIAAILSLYVLAGILAFFLTII